MTTDWSKTWAGANGWYDGYDSPNIGSFVDLNKLSGAEKDQAITAIQNNIIGLLEQKGVTQAQILDPTTDVGKFYETTLATATAGNTKDAFQSAAQHQTSATDIGNKWGADDDHTMGKTFLTKGVTASTTIADLYKKGFGRTDSEMAKDTTGPAYWQKQLDEGKMDIQQIANAFAQSEEAKIKDVYSAEYGRDTDEAGLQYWMNVSSATDSTATDPNAFDASKLVAASLASKGGQYEQTETSIRDAGWEYLGQASSQAQKDMLPTLGDGKLFTQMENTQVSDWVKAIDQDKTMTLSDVIGGAQTDSDGNVISGSGGILYNRGDYMDAHNQYNVDDWDEDGANPTGMGQFATLAEIQTAIDSGQTPDDIRKKLGAEKWAALTHEKFKKFGDAGTSQDLYDHASQHFGSTYWAPDKKDYDKQGDWTPTVPTKPGIPGDMPVDRRQIEYTPDLKPDPFSSTPYGAAKQEFDTEQSKVQVPTQPLASATVGQRLTGTSAKGVRMKRSKASRMGTIRGTKQLGREQQTQSLNI